MIHSSFKPLTDLYFMRFIRCSSLILLLGLTACVNLSGQLADSLSAAIKNHSDPTTVRDGVPAYLLMLDALLIDDAENAELLMASAKLYASYAGSFVGDGLRRRKLAQHGYAYAERALCLELEALCASISKSYAEFVVVLNQQDEDDISLIYGHASVWATWMQAHTSDWKAVIELPKLRAMMQHVLSVDSGHAEGEPHMYLGVMETLLPPALGGQAEIGKNHFEQAINLSSGQNLMARVLYAQHYARLVFDRELHDVQLNFVMQAEPEVEGFTLVNTMAQDLAHKLLQNADKYF